MFAAAPLDSPFPTQGLTSSQFISHVRILIAKLGLNPKQFESFLQDWGSIQTGGPIPNTWDAGNRPVTVGTFLIPMWRSNVLLLLCWINYLSCFTLKFTSLYLVGVSFALF